MSLSSMLKGSKERDKAFQELIKPVLPGKSMFKTLSGETAFSKYELVCPYCLNNSHEASLVGTAFDYLARAMIARTITNNKEYAIIDLKAATGLKRIENRVDKTVFCIFKMNM